VGLQNADIQYSMQRVIIIVINWYVIEGATAAVVRVFNYWLDSQKLNACKNVTFYSNSNNCSSAWCHPIPPWNLHTLQATAGCSKIPKNTETD